MTTLTNVGEEGGEGEEATNQTSEHAQTSTHGFPN